MLRPTRSPELRQFGKRPITPGHGHWHGYNFPGGLPCWMVLAIEQMHYDMQRKLGMVRQ